MRVFVSRVGMLEVTADCLEEEALTCPVVVVVVIILGASVCVDALEARFIRLNHLLRPSPYRTS